MLNIATGNDFVMMKKKIEELILVEVIVEEVIEEEALVVKGSDCCTRSNSGRGYGIVILNFTWSSKGEISTNSMPQP